MVRAFKPETAFHNRVAELFEAVHLAVPVRNAGEIKGCRLKRIGRGIETLLVPERLEDIYFRLFASRTVYFFHYFRYLHYIPDDEIVDVNKYKVLYRTQHRIFADIIQKMSSHSARLGNNLLYPVVEDPEKDNGEMEQK